MAVYFDISKTSGKGSDTFTATPKSNLEGLGPWENTITVKTNGVEKKITLKKEAPVYGTFTFREINTDLVQSLDVNTILNKCVLEDSVVSSSTPIVDFIQYETATEALEGTTEYPCYQANGYGTDSISVSTLWFAITFLCDSPLLIVKPYLGAEAYEFIEYYVFLHYETTSGEVFNGAWEEQNANPFGWLEWNGTDFDFDQRDQCYIPPTTTKEFSMQNILNKGLKNNKYKITIIAKVGTAEVGVAYPLFDVFSWPEGNFDQTHYFEWDLNTTN